MSDPRWSDRKIVLWMGAVILLLIVVVGVLAPDTGDDDARPTSYNTGPQGAKAAFLTLEGRPRRQPQAWLDTFRRLIGED